MKPKKIYSKFVPARGYISILILFWMVVREEYRNKIPWFAEIHEGIHLQQLIELLLLGVGVFVILIKEGYGWWSVLSLFLFYIWYVIEFLVKLLFTSSWRKAYMSISFEQEAYGNHLEKKYLERRPAFAWLKYIFKLKNNFV